MTAKRTDMKIGIIGAGDIARTYGSLWAGAGHAVTISSRNPDALGETAAGMGDGVEATTVDAAARDAEVVLIAVNYASLDGAIASIRDHVAGKVVIDATNPLVYEGDALKKVIGEDERAGVLLQRSLPDARVVKALTTMWTGYVEQEAHRPDPKAAMGYAGDDEAAKNVVRDLIADAGLAPVDLGKLIDSRPLDPPSPIWNHVLTADETRDRVERFRKGELDSGPLPSG